MDSCTSLAEMLEVNALARGNQPAIRCDQQVLSWLELNRLADSIAAAILHSGVHPQQAVGRLLNSWAEYPAAFVGALRAGAVATTISLRASVESQIALLSHAETKLAKFQRLKESHGVTSLPRNDLGKVVRRRLSASRAGADHQPALALHSEPGIDTARLQ